MHSRNCSPPSRDADEPHSRSEHKGARYGAVTNYDSAGWAIPQVLDAGFVRPSTYATPDIICHKGAINGKETVQIKAGSAVDIFWETWPKDHIGPVINYLANCHGPCEKVDKTKLEFCKIDEAGLIGTKPNRWATNKFFDDGFKWTVTIPEDTLPGNYVLRHELINIKGNTERDGAQHYPQCINFEVVGNGTTVLPGVPGMQLYKPTDPGVTKDFNKQVDSYPIPGPPVFKSGSGSAQAPGSYDAKPASSSTAASSGTAAPEAYEAPQAYDAGVKAADAKPSGAQTSKPAAAASGDKAQCAQTATVTVTVTAVSHQSLHWRYAHLTSYTDVLKNAQLHRQDLGQDLGQGSRDFQARG